MREKLYTACTPSLGELQLEAKTLYDAEQEVKNDFVNSGTYIIREYDLVMTGITSIVDTEYK